MECRTEGRRQPGVADGVLADVVVLCVLAGCRRWWTQGPHPRQGRLAPSSSSGRMGAASTWRFCAMVPAGHWRCGCCLLGLTLVLQGSQGDLVCAIYVVLHVVGMQQLQPMRQQSVCCHMRGARCVRPAATLGC
jgi:hypothetical protein